jgi:hypothetical protein
MIILKHGYRHVPMHYAALFRVILGDYLVGGGWAIVRLLFGVDTYIFYR